MGFVAIGVVWVQFQIRPVHDGGLHDEEIVVDATPDRPIATDNLMCSVVIDSTDQNGEVVVYTYAWYRDAVIRSPICPPNFWVLAEGSSYWLPVNSRALLRV